MKDAIGTIEYIKAVGDTVFITGRVSKRYMDSPLQLYELASPEIPGNLQAMMPLSVVRAKENAFMFAFPFYHAKVRRIASYFCVCVGGEAIAPPMKISNYKDFGENPYAFSVSGESECDAVGDGETDNTERISQALSKGGKVTLKAPGCYRVSTLILPENAELHIEKGATLFSCNADMPILSASQKKNIKLTGGGCIRVPGTRCASAVFYDCENIEISDVVFQGSRVASIELLACKNAYIGGVFAENAGFVCGKGTKNAYIFACSYDGAKDGLVLSETENICVTGCNFYAGTGSGIKLSPQGKEVRDIHITECVLKGRFSVAATDGIVCGANMHDNIYLSTCNSGTALYTSTKTDCGIYSEKRFINDRFENAGYGWRTEGKVEISGKACLNNGTVWQELYLKKNQFSFSAEVEGKGCLFVKDAAGNLIASQEFSTDGLLKVTLTVQLPKTALYALGVTGENAMLKQMLCVY
ncbi:MAG: hypothetical protein II359_03265 [Clostridia bacterium]|nr:hypothetical protein [Clostridia bacterium]